MDLEQRQHDLLYNIRVGIRYHMWRQSFFERWHRLTGIISLIGGSAAVATISAPPVAQGFAAMIAVAQAVDLIIDNRKYAELHKELRRRYTLLEPKLTATASPEEDILDTVEQEIKFIETEEPPIRPTLMDICQNQTLEATGVALDEAPKSFTKVPFWRRLFAQIY